MIRIRRETKLLPKSDVGDFRVRRVETEPLMILKADRRKSKYLQHEQVQLTLKNVSTKTITYFMYGFSASCPEAIEYADAFERPISPGRTSKLAVPHSRELETLLNVTAQTGCKAQLGLIYVEFQDESCWQPNVSAEMD